jgi:hypothetical protein
MQIYGPGADGTAAGKTDPGLPETRQQRTEHQYRGTHGPDQIVRRFDAADIAGVNGKRRLVTIDIGAENGQEFFCRCNIAQGRNICEVMFPGGEQCRKQQGQGRIFGATDPDLTLEAFSSMNDNLIQTRYLLLKGSIRPSRDVDKTHLFE